MLNDENTISYENNLLLASILCLLLVILFVLLLHVYARWLLAEGHLCGTSIASVFGPTARLRRSRTTSSSSSTTTTTYTYDIASFSSCSYPTKGLDQKVMESIPTFVYRPSSASEGAVLECAICLSGFEEKEVGRSLPRCSHAFHVDCIDMWLFCHSTCPICRANVAVDDHAVHERVGRDDGTNRTAEIESSRLSTNNNEDHYHHIVVQINNVDSSSDDQVVGSSECSSSSSSVLDCSLSRMLSRNRSESRVHPSSFIAIN